MEQNSISKIKFALKSALIIGIVSSVEHDQKFQTTLNTIQIYPLLFAWLVNWALVNQTN